MANKKTTIYLNREPQEVEWNDRLPIEATLRFLVPQIESSKDVSFGDDDVEQELTEALPESRGHYFTPTGQPAEIYRAYPYFTLGYTGDVAEVKNQLVEVGLIRLDQTKFRRLAELPHTYVVGPFADPETAFAASDFLRESMTKSKYFRYAEPEYDLVDPIAEVLMNLLQDSKIAGFFKSNTISTKYNYLFPNESSQTADRPSKITEEKFNWNLDQIKLPRRDNGNFEQYIKNEIRVAVIDQGFNKHYFDLSSVEDHYKKRINRKGEVSAGVSQSGTRHGSSCVNFVQRVARGVTFALIQLPTGSSMAISKTSIMSAALKTAANLNPHVIACSVKTEFGYSGSVNSTWKYVVDQITTPCADYPGIPIVWSGPDSMTCKEPMVQSHHKIISVGASRVGKQIYTNTNCEQCTDMVAPGEGVHYGYGIREYETGTSYAAPHVAGLLAILIHEYLNGSSTEPPLTPFHYHALAARTCTKANKPCGAGIIQVEDAVEKLRKLMQGDHSTVEEIKEAVTSLQGKNSAWERANNFA